MTVSTRIAAALAALVFAEAASGQQSDTTAGAADTTRLPPIQVIGSILRRGAGPSVGSGIPARVSVIGRDRVQSWQPRTLGHLLEREAGMSLYDDLGNSAKMTLVSRGFTASPVVGLPQGLSVFLDGVPVNEPDAGQVNFDLLPLEFVERIEILRGTASLLGPHSLGGAVNLVTQGGGESRRELELRAGSFGSYAARLSGAGGWAPRWSWFAGAGYDRDGGWRQLTDARRFNVLGSVARSGAKRGARLQAMFARSNAETAGSLPFSVYRDRPDSNLSSGDFEDLTQVHLAGSAYTAFGGGLGSAVAYFRSNDAERFNVNQVTDPDVRNFARNQSAGANADWYTTFPALAGTVGLRIGAGASSHRSRVRIFAERIEPGLTTHVESPITKADAFTVLDYVAGRFSASAGARYDVTRVPFRNRLNSARDTTSMFQQLSPRGGITIALTDGVALFASVGRSFRPPALIELACADPNEPCPLPFALGDDPPLAPVIATTHEAGARWLAGPLSLSASVYRTNVHNDIFLFPYDDANEPDGSTIDGFFANLAQTRREGVELTSRAALGSAALFANYAWGSATFRVSGVEPFSIREEAGGGNAIEVGDRLPLIPQHTLTIGGSAPVTRAVRLGLEAQYTGDRVLRGDEANEEEPLPGYVLLDGSLGVAFRRWGLDLVARNLLNNRYATFGTFNINQGAFGGATLERFLTPGPRRNLALVLRRELR